MPDPLIASKKQVVSAPAFLFSLIAYGLILVTSQCGADTLTTRNNETIEGELLSLDQGELQWKTRYKGILVIPLDVVHSLDTSTLFDVTFKNERLERRCQLRWKADLAELHCEGKAPLPLQPASIASVTPTLTAPTEPRQRGGTLELSLRNTRKEIHETFSELSADGFWRKGVLKHNADIAFQHASEDGDTTLDHREYQYQLDFFLDQRWYALALAHRLSEPSNDHFYEETLGTGLGREWLTPQLHLSTELVAGSIGRHYRAQPDIRYEGFRWHAQVEYQPKDWNVKFEHEQTYAADISGVDLRRFRADNSLKVPLQDTLQAFLKFRYEHVYGAPDTFVTPQHETSIGLSYDW